MRKVQPSSSLIVTSRPLSPTGHAVETVGAEKVNEGEMGMHGKGNWEIASGEMAGLELEGTAREGERRRERERTTRDIAVMVVIVGWRNG